MLMFVILMLLLNVQMAGPQTDQMGHLGGLVTGGFVGLCLARGDENKRFHQAGLGLLLIMTGSMLTVFYTAIEVN